MMTAYFHLFRPARHLPSGLLSLAVLCALPAEARAVSSEAFTMEIIVGGAPLAEHAARGTRYVEVIEGREYAVRLSNRTGQRVAVALSLDGLNSIDAKSTQAYEARKWILGPWQTIMIEGWQTGQAKARRFFFTSEAGSYGAWLGETRNLGVISAAVFREKQPRPAPIVMYRLDGGEPGARSERSGAEAPRSQAGAGEKQKMALADDLAATGIGEEVSHPVVQVAFDADPAPVAVLSLRYEYHDALVRLGVLPRPTMDCLGGDPLARRECARGFTDTGFAPDPWKNQRQ